MRSVWNNRGEDASTIPQPKSRPQVLCTRDGFYHQDGGLLSAPLCALGGVPE